MNTHTITYPKPLVRILQHSRADTSSVSSNQSYESHFTDIERPQNPMIKNFIDNQEDDLESFFDQLE
ncbi:unnamed protein product (macronuclear) [Paramecium tetraurelia]|uniref:Uncharacterized protein n=2 Tax=Paramecium TaxID=5884 RepID=A0EBT0_PARTE|nr:uncharacterized protein GSPATT00025482001 [Paramecium tetraurelia]CAD8189227.1 unnamed protein product [Paramecium octaurelia]CAK92747.1 unnamed protein product [Paramecium tetraurelia]|eukprot:XP_001460144.1 hypothetical protein (macronuclear) [Paramecium tetraurelia strain d4-2]